MNLPPNIAKLYAIASGLGGKRIRLAGSLLAVKCAVVHNMAGKDTASLDITLVLDEETCPDQRTCNCETCKTGRAINKANAQIVVNLVTSGSCPRTHLLLDSSFAGKEGFHVKLRNTNTGCSHVGHGSNLTIAIATAATAAISTAP